MHTFPSVSSALLVAAVLAAPQGARAEVPWRASFAAAQSEARAAKRLLFVELTVFPEALKIGDRLGIRSDPAYALVAPDGTVAWKHVGMIDKAALLRAMCPGQRGKETLGSPPCAMATRRAKHR